MNCQHWKPILFDFARGLQTDQTREALLHTQECKKCRLELEEQQHLSETLNSLAANAKHEGAQDISPALLDSFRKAHGSTKWNRRVLIFARAAIVIGAILGGSIWYRTLDHHTGSAKSEFQNAPYDDEFIPLLYGSSAVNSMQVVRVELESSALQDLGFPRVPEWEDRPIQADIIVGEDGLPQAIRFVNLQQH